MEQRRLPGRLAAVAAVLAPLLVLVAAMPAAAHEGSFSANYVDGSNLVLLTYNVHEPEAEIPVTFNFRLFDMVGVPIPYDTADITVTRDGEQVVARSLSISANLDVNTVIELPAGGAHVISVAFVHEGRTVSNGEFPLHVHDTEAATGSTMLIVSNAVAFALGIGVAVGLPWLARRRPGAEISAEPAPAGS